MIGTNVSLSRMRQACEANASRIKHLWQLPPASESRNNFEKNPVERYSRVTCHGFACHLQLASKAKNVGVSVRDGDGLMGRVCVGDWD